MLRHNHASLSWRSRNVFEADWIATKLESALFTLMRSHSKVSSRFQTTRSRASNIEWWKVSTWEVALQTLSTGVCEFYREIGRLGKFCFLFQSTFWQSNAPAFNQCSVVKLLQAANRPKTEKEISFYTNMPHFGWAPHTYRLSAESVACARQLYRFCNPISSQAKNCRYGEREGLGGEAVGDRRRRLGRGGGGQIKKYPGEMGLFYWLHGLATRQIGNKASPLLSSRSHHVADCQDRGPSTQISFIRLLLFLLRLRGALSTVDRAAENAGGGWGGGGPPLLVRAASAEANSGPLIGSRIVKQLPHPLPLLLLLLPTQWPDIPAASRHIGLTLLRAASHGRSFSVAVCVCVCSPLWSYVAS